MEFLTNDKLTIVGAAGMIGSNMAQTAIMMHLTPNLCLYDPYAVSYTHLDVYKRQVKTPAANMSG